MTAPHFLVRKTQDSRTPWAVFRHCLRCGTGVLFNYFTHATAVDAADHLARNGGAEHHQQHEDEDARAQSVARSRSIAIAFRRAGVLNLIEPTNEQPTPETEEGDRG